MSPKPIHNYKILIFDLDGTLYMRKGINKKTAVSHLFRLPMLVSYQKARKELISDDYGSEKLYFSELHKKAAEKRFSFLKNDYSLKRKINTGQNWYKNRFYPTFCRILSKKFKSKQKGKTTTFSHSIHENRWCHL